MSQYGSFGSQQRQFRFRCRTVNRWLTGSVGSSQRRLVDLLNSTDESGVLVAEDVLALERPDDEDSGQSIGHVNISTSSILFAMPVEDAPRAPDMRIRSNLQQQTVRAGVGPYEVVGTVFLQAGTKAKDVLMAVRAPFIVIAGAELRQVGDPNFVEEHPAVLVNRRHVDFISPQVPGR